MSSEYNLLEKDDNEEPNLDDDDDNEDKNSVKATNKSLAKTAMTESYSEILNSPLFDNTDVPEHQIEITKRRPTTLNRKQSSQCECVCAFKCSFHLIVSYWM